MVNYIKSKFKAINWEAGNGSIIMGTVTMMLAFLSIIVIIEIFNIQFTHTKTQMLTDVIADGTAVAGNTYGGFDESRMEAVAQTLVERNGVADDISYTIIAEPERDELGQSTGNTIVTATVEATKEHLISGLLNEDTFTIQTSAEVWVGMKIGGGGWLDSSLAVNPVPLPFETTQPGSRSGAYVTWFMNYYLVPDSNPVYDSSIYDVGSYLLHDYLVCMGFGDVYPYRSTAEWYTLFSSSPSGWTKATSLSEIQASANNGKPVVMFFTNDSGVKDICLVVPTQGVVEHNQIATAHAGQSNWNYKRINAGSLVGAEFYIHE